MEIGDKIKYYRKQKGLSQEELAMDICTRSYLSKIENNVAKPHQNTINLLFQKLGVPSTEAATINTEEINGKLYEWYEIIKSRDNDKARKLEVSINEEIFKLDDLTTFIQYQLFSLRYQLLLRNMNESKQLILKLESVENHLSEKQKYYFYYFYGLYKYIQDDFIDSLEYYSKAEKIDQQIHINEPDLFYLLSLVHSRLYHISLSIHYANMALTGFNHDLDYMKIIETRSILSINYIYLEEYDKAKHHLLSSLKIAEKFNDTYLKNNIYHNLGYLYSKTNNHHKAIDYYFKSMNLKKGEIEKVTNTIYYLTESYFALNQINAAEEWLEKGLNIAEEKNMKSLQIKYHLLKLERCHEKDKSLKFIEETGLTYLEEKKMWKELSETTKILANYFANQQHYKTAYQYCCLADSNRKKIQK